MSGLLDGVLGTLMQGDAVEQIASKVGLDKNQAQSVMGSAIPMLLQAMNKKATTPDGANAIESLAGEQDGGKILNGILGNSLPAVEEHISKSSGVASGLVGKLLSSVAPMLISSLLGKSGGLGGGIGSLLSGITGEMQSSGAGNDQNFIKGLLDKDNDGSVVDDVAKMGMDAIGKIF